MCKTSGISIKGHKKNQYGHIVEVLDLDIVYEATPAQFAWWFCEQVMSDFDEKDIKTLRAWGEIAPECTSISFRIKCCEWLKTYTSEKKKS